MKHDTVKRKTGQRTGFVVQIKYNNFFLESVVTGSSRYELRMAYVWDSIIKLRQAITGCGIDGNVSHIRQVLIDQRGRTIKVIGPPIPLYSRPAAEDDDKPVPKLDFEKMLVDLCTDLEQSGYDRDDMEFESWLEASDHDELQKWWHKHKATTEAGREKLRKEALALLTNEQKKVLGLTDDVDDEEEGD